MAVTAADVKALRDRTGAGMMDCKAALTEADGDVDKAIEILRVKGAASAAKRAERGTSEGVVASYIHANRQGRLAGRGPVRDGLRRPQRGLPGVRLRGRAARRRRPSPQLVSAEDIPEDERDAERRVFEREGQGGGQARRVVEKIVEGQLKKWAAEVALLEQPHFNAEKHDGKTIEELRQAIAAKTGENVRIARVSRLRGRREE